MKNRPSTGLILLNVWVAFNVTLSAIANLPANLVVIATIRPLVVLQNILVITCVVVVGLSLKKAHPHFSWWIGRLFKKDDGSTPDDSSAGNATMLLFKIPVVRWFYGGILILALPSLAKIEEEWFREGTTSWSQAIIRSLLFGLVHCLVGVPIGFGIAIGCAGLWFSHVYFQGGVELSTLHHTTYNLIVVILMIVALLGSKLSEKSEAANAA